jgi:hypothetical protein
LFALPVPAAQGQVMVYLGMFKTLYVGEISISGLLNGEVVDTFSASLRKPLPLQIQPAHLSQGPEAHCIPYRFQRPVTELSIQFALEPGWKSRWIHKQGYYPTDEDVRVLIRERR